MRLMLMGLKSSWRNPGYNLRSRLFHTAWFPLAALLPQAIAVKILRRGLLPRRRRAEVSGGGFDAVHARAAMACRQLPSPGRDGDHRKASA